jgi:hypothetical protein
MTHNGPASLCEMLARHLLKFNSDCRCRSYWCIVNHDPERHTEQIRVDNRAVPVLLILRPAHWAMI